MQFDQLKRREFITLLDGAAAWPLGEGAAAGESRTDRLPREVLGAPLPASLTGGAGARSDHPISRHLARWRSFNAQNEG
jgi:hypothetical protein